MQARIIKTSFWSDPRVESLSLRGRLLYLFCLTNPYIGMTGAFQIANERLQYESKLPSELLRVAKNELEQAELVIFRDSWIVVLNTEKQNHYALGAKTGPAYQKELDSLPVEIRELVSDCSDTLSEKEDRVSNQFDTPRNHKSEIRKQKTEIDNKKTIEYLRNIPESDKQELLSRFEMSEKQLLSKSEDLLNYCRSHGKQYKDYRAFLLNALKKDFKPRQPAERVKLPEVSDPVSPERVAALRAQMPKIVRSV